MDELQRVVTKLERVQWHTVVSSGAEPTDVVAMHSCGVRDPWKISSTAVMAKTEISPSPATRAHADPTTECTTVAVEKEQGIVAPWGATELRRK